MTTKDYRTELQMSIQYILVHVGASLFIAVVVFFALDTTALPLMIMTLGMCVGGYKIAQESTRPPHWLPRERAFEHAGDTDIRNFVRQRAVKPIRMKMARIAMVETIFFGLLTRACVVFQPFTPNEDLFVLINALFACFMIGVTLATSTCWLIGYRAILSAL